MTNYRLGLLLVTISAVAWSTAGLFTRLVPLDSAVLLFWRGSFGALGLGFAMVVLERRNPLRELRSLGGAGLLFSLVSAIGMVLFITSLKQTTVAHVAVIYATIPFAAAALGWLVLAERPSTSGVIASLIALVGVVIMVGIGNEGTMFGDALAFGMMLCMAVMMIIARRNTGMPVMAAACLSALASAAVCWPFADIAALSWHDFLLLALFGLMNSALGMVTFTYGARLLPPIETALIGALDAPLAPLWVWIAVNEIPGMQSMIGGTLVFAAVALHVTLSAMRPRSVTT